jgi:hypothetical protein
LLAVGFSNSQEVDVYDSTTLNFRFSADVKGLDNGNLSKVAWSSDGTHLLAGGAYETQFQGVWKTPLVTFDRDGKRAGALVPLSDDAILNLQPCGNAVAIAAGDPGFGLVDADGGVTLWKSGVTPDLRDKVGDAFTIAPDAKQVRFGLADRADEPVVFDLIQATLANTPDPVSDFRAPVIEGLPVSNWKNDYRPTFAGKPISLDQYETSRSLAIRPDRGGFVLGTEYSLRAFDDLGRQLWEQAGPSVAWGVNFSADGRIVVVAYSDGTIRWQRASDGKELLALFVNRKTKAWVAWTPSGYYMASPGGEDLIGWHINRGWNQTADFFPASQFAKKYARPDVVRRVLDTLDEAEAVRLANVTHSSSEALPIIETLPPVLSILSPIDNTRVPEPTVTVSYLIRSPSGVPLENVGALINGQTAGARISGDDTEVKRCLEETHGLGRTEGALQGCRGSLTVETSPGTTEIGIFARAGGKTSNIATTRVTR